MFSKKESSFCLWSLLKDNLLAGLKGWMDKNEKIEKMKGEVGGKRPAEGSGRLLRILNGFTFVASIACLISGGNSI